MHRVRFRDPAGSVRHGTWHDDEITFAGETYDAQEVDLLAPAEPTKIVCVGRNYVEHVEEFDNPLPERPLLFLKTPNTVADPGTTITLPAGKDRIDYEGELALVIGEQCRGVTEADAMDVVAGFTAANDLSNRDDQNVEQNWVRGKAFDNACPIGPVLVPPEAVPKDASLEVRVNGEVRQRGSRDQFIFSIPELLAEITTYLTLEPGDVVLTGTPAGVGALDDGDEVEVDIEGIPTLVNDVRVP